MSKTEKGHKWRYEVLLRHQRYSSSFFLFYFFIFLLDFIQLFDSMYGFVQLLLNDELFTHRNESDAQVCAPSLYYVDASPLVTPY